MEARDDQHDDGQSHEQWWAGLSQEERYQAIETTRLDQDPDYPHGRRPTGDRAEWIRHRPEYLERFAGADNIARQDDPGFGPDPVPGAHEDTHPLREDG